MPYAEESGKVDAARAFLLGNLIETHLPLSDAEREALRIQLEQEGDTTMDVTELTWAGQIDLRVSLRVKRDDIRRVVQRRFGQVTPQVEAFIAATETEEDLDALLDRAVVARTEDELHGSQSG